MGIYILSYIDVSQSTDDIFPKGLRPPKHFEFEDVSQSTDDIFPKGLRPPKHFKLDLEGRLEIISTTK